MQYPPVRSVLVRIHVLVALSGVGCTAATTTEDASTEEAITIDAKKPLFPWVGPLTDDEGRCTASLIAPQVIMTAAHCVPADGTAKNAWIELPIAPGKPKVRVTAYARYRDPSGHVHDGLNSAGYVELNEHDIAIGVLETPITLARYPERSTRREVGATVYGMGTTRATPERPILTTPNDDVEAGGLLWYQVRRGYWGERYGEPGDSGGPWVAAGTQRIVGMLRGGRNSELLYRLDASSCWLASKVQQFGGEGPQGDRREVPSLGSFCR